MENQMLEIKQEIQVQKPVHEVFQAIIDPAKMTGYFISNSSGSMEEGKEIEWQFPEFEEKFTIKVNKMEPDKYISYYWEVEGKSLLVEIRLSPKENNSTLVTVTEKSMPNDEKGIKWLAGNTGGWSNFLACLKAYLEYGINLRKGAFDFMRKKQA
jgi:uncharacterized protein YndB with AHSA1/START domain